MDQVQIILPILKKIPIFAELNINCHHAIIENILLQFYPKEFVLFNEGDVANAMYIVKSGKVEIFHPANQQEEKIVKELGENDFFGEMALISNNPRNASARTKADTEVFVLKKSDFLFLLSTNPQMANMVSLKFIDRLKENQRV
jgi:CRP-like cAMP-binding protein